MDNQYSKKHVPLNCVPSTPTPSDQPLIIHIQIYNFIDYNPNEKDNFHFFNLKMGSKNKDYSVTNIIGSRTFTLWAINPENYPRKTTPWKTAPKDNYPGKLSLGKLPSPPPPGKITLRGQLLPENLLLLKPTYSQAWTSPLTNRGGGGSVLGGYFRGNSRRGGGGGNCPRGYFHFFRELIFWG